jgi:ABC-type multidrug transport system fused ATPase/permease subunit
MIKENISHIKVILNKSEIIKLYLYFLFSLFIGILEIVGIGILPVFFSILIDKNILIDKLDFNQNFQNIAKEFLSSSNFILYICIGIIIFYLVKSLFLLFFYFFDAKLIKDLKVSISSKLFEIYLNKNYIFHSINNPIILGRNISSEVNISVSQIKSFLTIIKEVIQLILIFFLLLFVNLKVTLSIFLIFLVLSIIYLKLSGKKLKQKSEIAFQERGFKSKIINQILNAIIEVKLYKKEKFIIEKFIYSIKKEFQSIMFLDIIGKIPRIFIEIFIVSVVCFAILFFIRLGYDIEAIIAFIAVYFFAALRVYPSINSILIQNMALINGKVSIEKLSNEFKKSYLNSDEKNLDKVKFKFDKFIEFRDVSFNYPNRENILKKIDLKIFKNTITGIIGETGSGKSTFIKLVMNLLEANSGKIEIDGIPISSVKNKWQEKIGYIPQNFYILDDTILENIVFSQNKKDVDFKKISEVLKFSKLEEVVKSLPDGLNAIVGPNGKLLSGGQAQRLAIARALYQNKDLLIFDEATNALDEKTEREIIENIVNLKNFKTIIIISHNRKVLDICDKVIEFKGNKVNVN